MYRRRDMSEKALPALSIRQPWAELILRGAKTVELRNWTDSYRGPLLLHTGKLFAPGFESDPQWQELFLGGFVGVVTLLAIVPMDRERWTAWKEQHMDRGGYQSGFYAWIMGQPRRLDHPVPASGQRGIFYPERSLLELVLTGIPVDKTSEAALPCGQVDSSKATEVARHE
jgi:hypothetical protein